VSLVKHDIRAVLFDLDGTLADTLADLASATNWALQQVGCPPCTVDSYRYKVGDGARRDQPPVFSRVSAA